MRAGPRQEIKAVQDLPLRPWSEEARGRGLLPQRTGKAWWRSKSVWLAMLQAAGGILEILAANTGLGWGMVGKSVLDVILRAVTREPIAAKAP